MKQFFILIIFLASINHCYSQIKALTEDGREVILYDNGTWKYASDSSTENSDGTDSIKTNPTVFTKSDGSTFLLKSKNVNVGIYLNPKKWTFQLPKSNEKASEYSFELKSGNGFAILISEKTEIDLENMKVVALINAQSAAADAKIISSEYRIVNGVKVLCLQIKATVKGIKFMYFGYYYSNENGTIQLLSYSTEKLFPQSQKELEEFLNGFVVLQK